MGKKLQHQDRIKILGIIVPAYGRINKEELNDLLETASAFVEGKGDGDMPNQQPNSTDPLEC